MKANTISGQRQYAFVSQFNYIREAGTEGEEKAACRIEKELSEIAEKWGQGELQIRREPFEIETWQVDEAVFTVTEPYEKTYTVRGCFAAANTAPEGVEAPFLYVENGDPVSLSHAEGKIVLINGGANAENYEKLEKAGAVGFLILTGTPLDKDEDRLPDYRTLRGVKNPKLPCAVIHYLDAMELVERGASRARLVLQQKKIRRTSKNIILRIPGTEQPEEILTLTAHYDSVPQGPGAYDNMAGAAIIMELAHYFAENRPKRTLECIWFGAEELGLCGSRAYVKALQHERRPRRTGHRRNRAWRGSNERGMRRDHGALKTGGQRRIAHQQHLEQRFQHLRMEGHPGDDAEPRWFRHAHLPRYDRLDLRLVTEPERRCPGRNRRVSGGCRTISI